MPDPEVGVEQLAVRLVETRATFDPHLIWYSFQIQLFSVTYSVSISVQNHQLLSAHHRPGMRKEQRWLAFYPKGSS